MANTIKSEEFWSEEYESKLTLAELIFIYNQGEIALKDTVDTSQIITSRTSVIIPVPVAFMAGIVSYWYSKTPELEIGGEYIILSLSSAYFFILSAFTVSIIRPKKYYNLGFDPKSFTIEHFNKPLYNNGNESDVRLKEFYRVAIPNMHKSIVNNKLTNSQRWAYYKISLWFLVLSPVIILVVKLLFGLASSFL